MSNAELVQQLKEAVDQHDSGLIMDIELLHIAFDVGSKAVMPAETDIDPNTGLSHRKE